MTSQAVNRRHFIKTSAAAGAMIALNQSLQSHGQQPDATIKLALIGCAHIHTPSFVKLLMSREDVSVKYVWDHDQARAEKSATRLKARPIANTNEIWSDSTVTGVVICSETNRHRDLVMAAAKANKHMFVEKPLGINAAESREMAAAITKASRLFTTGYFMRTNPVHLFLKEQVQKGAFGRITRARGSNCHSGSLGGWFDTEWRWMADPKIAGVGAFGDLGTHSLDILMWLLGEVESVTANVQVITGRYGECDETGEAMIKFKSGVLATLAAGWVDVENPVTLLISGTEGHATVINGELFFKSKQVPQADPSKPWKELPPAPQLPLHQFIDAMAGKPGMPLVTPAEAAARVSVMEAAYKAAKKHTWMSPA